MSTFLTFLSLGIIVLGTIFSTKLAEKGTDVRSSAKERTLKSLSGNCGVFPKTKGDERSGGGCTLPDQKPSVSFECASCLAANQPGFREWYDNAAQAAACNNMQIVSSWRHMEPDGKRNFYKGDLTLPGTICNCSCSRELADPNADFSDSNSSLPAPSPVPTVIPSQIPTINIFIPPTSFPKIQPTEEPQPTEETQPEKQPEISSPTIEPRPTEIIEQPISPPITYSAPFKPDIPKKETSPYDKALVTLPKTIINSVVTGFEIGKTAVGSGKNLIFRILSNFLKETEF